jgi:hypothetical protein
MGLPLVPLTGNGLPLRFEAILNSRKSLFYLEPPLVSRQKRLLSHP